MTITHGYQRVTLGPYSDHVGMWFHLNVRFMGHQHNLAGHPLSNQGM